MYISVYIYIYIYRCWWALKTVISFCSTPFRWRKRASTMSTQRSTRAVWPTSSGFQAPKLSSLRCVAVCPIYVSIHVSVYVTNCALAKSCVIDVDWLPDSRTQLVAVYSCVCVTYVCIDLCVCISNYIHLCVYVSCYVFLSVNNSALNTSCVTHKVALHSLQCVCVCVCVCVCARACNVCVCAIHS